MLTNTLAVNDTKTKNDNNFLQILIEKVLKDFNIDKDNTTNIVINNASNMVKIIKRNSMKVRKQIPVKKARKSLMIILL